MPRAWYNPVDGRILEGAPQPAVAWEDLTASAAYQNYTATVEGRNFEVSYWVNWGSDEGASRPSSGQPGAPVNGWFFPWEVYQYGGAYVYTRDAAAAIDSLRRYFSYYGGKIRLDWQRDFQGRVSSALSYLINQYGAGIAPATIWAGSSSLYGSEATLAAWANQGLAQPDGTSWQPRSSQVQALGPVLPADFIAAAAPPQLAIAGVRWS